MRELEESTNLLGEGRSRDCSSTNPRDLHNEKIYEPLSSGEETWRRYRRGT